MENGTNKTDTTEEVIQNTPAEETEVSKSEESTQKEAKTKNVDDREMKKEDVKVEDNSEARNETDTTVEVKQKKRVEETVFSKREESKHKEAETEDLETEKVNDQEIKKEDFKVDDNAEVESETDTTVEVTAENVVKETEVSNGEELKQKEAEREIKKEDVKIENVVVVNGKPIQQKRLDLIKSQVHYYFGDINLKCDNFMGKERRRDQGWIPMTVMLRFRLLSLMSRDPEVILKALEDSDLIEISEDRTKIRRSLDYPKPVFDEYSKQAQIARSVYLEGFPITGTTLPQLKEFFKHYEPIQTIVMRKDLDEENNRHFNGSIFLIFSKLYGAKRFMARESVKYGETELVRKWSKDYLAEKEGKEGKTKNPWWY